MIQCDVTSEESCKSAVAKTLDLFGTVHILVNIGMLSFMFYFILGKERGKERG